MLLTYVESQLACVIGRTQLTQPRADRRLNGIENVSALVFGEESHSGGSAKILF